MSPYIHIHKKTSVKRYESGSVKELLRVEQGNLYSVTQKEQTAK